MNITFRREFEWALFPSKQNIQVSEHDNRDMYSRNFRWIRQNRRKEFCLPWRLGHELGWYLHCPIDITLRPLDDCEIELDETELEAAHKFLGMKNIWKRERSLISVENDWMKLYQFKGIDSKWEAMFIPNGDGTIEWRQGISLVMPSGYSMLIAPLESNNCIGVHYGVLSHRHNTTNGEIGGLSIAIRPSETLRISRGEKIARLIPICNESLKIDCIYEDHV